MRKELTGAAMVAGDRWHSPTGGPPVTGHRSPLLTINNLSIRFGASTVVDDVSLTVNRGEVLALVGESGSGKSLTAQSILQLLPGNANVSGTVKLDAGDDGHPSPVTRHPSPNLLSLSEREITRMRGRDVGMIFQEPMTALNPLHTIDRQMIEGYCWHHGIARTDARAKAKLTELYAAVGLQHLASRGKLYPHQLSGGERQRVMIAMAITCDPALLIADEPTTALDVTLVGQILALLKSLQQIRNMGMIFITHDLLMVQQIADRVAVMQSGKIVETGRVAEVFANPQHAYTKMLLAATPSGAPSPVPADAREVLSTSALAVRYPVKSPILRRTLRTVDAVKGASFTLREGETLGVVGESGSGKTSLGYALLRLIQSEGPILFLGRRFDTLNRHDLRAARKDVQIVFQDPYSSLNPRMTVGEIVAEGLKLHGHKLVADESVRSASGPLSGGGQERSDVGGKKPPSIDELVTSILTQVGLTPEMAHRYPHEFSGGQRQRIAIARAMVLRPALVVLDEPTSALDMSVQKQVLELLKSLQQTHRVSYIFISHDLRTVRAMAHQVMVLKRGEVVEYGTAERLFAAPQHDYTKRLFAAAFGDKHTHRS